MNGLAAAFFEIQAKEIINLMKEVNKEEITLKNQAAMIGLASMLTDSISRVEEVSKEKAKELDDEGQAVWNEWYKKNQEYAKGNETVIKILEDNFED